ncbi:MAG: hypothetical protein NE334_12485 [Lentisphaeraceae bacterium]|nr:hypothetical protein [Lentisphaeraceae bacterium]
MTSKWIKGMAAGSLLLSSALHGAVDFTKDLLPILEERCLKCHGHVKESGKVVTKGDLDITKPESVKEFLKAGHPEDSTFYTLVISDDEDDYMPPKGDRLTDAQKKVISDWIKQGASFEGYSKKAKGETLLEKLAKGTSAPSKAAIAHFEQMGALVLPLAQNSPLLQLNFKPVGSKSNPDMTKRIVELKGNIVWLNLSKANINDASLVPVTELKKLTRLHLDNTGITDAGLQSVASLTNLEYLNLYNTAVTDAGIAKLASLKSLKKLFLWQSKVTEAGVKSLQAKLPNTYIHFMTPKMKAPVKKEEKKKAPKKK